MHDVTDDITDDVIYDVTGRYFFPRFLDFREFSGMFVTVRDVFGVIVLGRSPCTWSRVWRMRERKRAIFSRAFWFFGVFRSVLWIFREVFGVLEVGA